MTRQIIISEEASCCWDDVYAARNAPLVVHSIPMSRASKAVLLVVALGMGLVMGGILG